MTFKSFKLKWYHGVLFLIGVNLLTFAWAFTDVKYYNNLNKPWFAPPSFVFGPVWILNNILVITGNIWTFNRWQDFKNGNFQFLSEIQQNKLKKSFSNLAILQGLSWFNYIIFTALSFGTKIPAMFFWPTFSMWILTVFSIFISFQIDKMTFQEGFVESLKKFKSITLTFTTLILWLTIASLLGLYVWINN
jgi:tryptophan-rich sensory protein